MNLGEIQIGKTYKALIGADSSGGVGESNEPITVKLIRHARRGGWVGKCADGKCYTFRIDDFIREVKKGPTQSGTAPVESTPKTWKPPKPLNRPATASQAPVKTKGPTPLNRPAKAKGPSSAFADRQMPKLSELVKPEREYESFNEKHLIIKALAGTGKTTSLIEGVCRLKGAGKLKGSEQQNAIWDAICKHSDKSVSVGMIAFNKSIAAELGKRLGSMGTASTAHSLGAKAVNRAFRSPPLERYRTDKLFESYHNCDIRDMNRQNPNYFSAVRKLVSLCKQTLSPTDEESLKVMAVHYGIEMPTAGAFLEGKVFETVAWLIDRCQRDIESFDFDDMIWLPVVKNLTIPRFDLLMVDEAQDLNRCQQELMLKAGKRLVFVGDVHQAIYGFAGADTQSMGRLAGMLGERGEVTELPLTISRRCGHAIVGEAKKIVPEFEGHESNPKGSVTFGVDQDAADRDCKDGDMILCRVNAPLISLVFKFIKNGRKAQIQGRDIGTNLLEFIKYGLKADSVKELQENLETYETREVAALQRRKFPDEAAIIAVTDKCDCVRALAAQAGSIREIEERVEKIFKDESTGGILLSSVHRAKGLEADRVWIREPSKMPHPMAREEWQQEQERNLKYVAITRAKSELNFVKDTQTKKG